MKMKFNIRRQGRPRKFKNWASIFHIIIMALLVMIVVYVVEGFRTRLVLADTYEKMYVSQTKTTAEVVGEKDGLAKQLKVATAKPKPQILTDQEARDMIASAFPSQYRQAFYQVTAHCEDSALATTVKHTNKDGSVDIGMSQINNQWHTKRVERMFGLDFETAMSIPILNYIYAAYLVEHDQNFHQWSCAKILGVKS